MCFFDAGKNVVAQQQLAEATLLHYKSGAEDNQTQPGGSEWEAHAAIVAGLVETLEMLRKRNGGRFPTEDRITQEVILSSVVSKAKGKMLSAIGTVAGCCGVLMLRPPECGVHSSLIKLALSSECTCVRKGPQPGST